MKILVLNSGSSSIKFKLFGMPVGILLADGLVQRIGDRQSLFRGHHYRDGQELTSELAEPIADHGAGLKVVMTWLGDKSRGIVESLEDIQAVGHRVVHGAESFQEPTIITDEVLKTIKECAALAPLHNPANQLGIEVARRELPDAQQVAIFDTAFHQTLPDYAYQYAIPEKLYKDYKIRRYGFHGTSHAYVSKAAADHLKKDVHNCNFITVHLGNGASMAAIKNGRSVDTSMGLTPLEGLVMGTRSGDLDPAIPFYLMKEAGLSTNQIDRVLNKESGLKGLCGFNDMREIVSRAAAGDAKAALALTIFCYRIKKYIGAYLAVLGEIDAVIFTAGIGENSETVRRLVCDGLSGLGISLDNEKNQNAAGEIVELQSETSQIKVLKVATNEELEIARQTVAVIAGK
jgi:acetate kinase